MAREVRAHQVLERVIRRGAPGLVLLALGIGCTGSDGAAPAAGGAGGQSSGGAGQGSGGAGQGSGGAGQPSGGAGQASGGGGQAPLFDVPSDTSQDGVIAFINAQSYRSSSWASAMTGVTSPPSGTTSPHGLEWIWYNQGLRQSHAEGHLGSFSDPFAVGSMSVKEMYTGDAVIGHAAVLRTDANWLYFCTASEDGRCYIGSKAGAVFFSSNALGSCTCHSGGTVVTVAAMPPP